MTAEAGNQWGPRVLAAAALAGPLWPTWIGIQQAQIGRALVLLVSAAIAVDFVRGRVRPTRPAWATVGVVGSFAALAVWNALSAATWGCFCGGTAQGIGDSAVLAVVTGVVMLYASPRMTFAILAAAAGGVLAAGLLSVVGLQDLHANTYRPSESQSRLEGVYGNPNFLGFALAMGVPIAIAAAAASRGLLRLVAVVGTVALGGLLLLTFSRGSLLAAGIGGTVALLITFPVLRRARVAIPAGLAVPALILLFIASPFYRNQRVEADFGREKASQMAEADHSGWTTKPVGLVNVGGATLANPTGSKALAVTTTQAKQGVTYPFPKTFVAGRWKWRLNLAAPAGGERLKVAWKVGRYDETKLAAGTATLRPGTSAQKIDLEVETRQTDWLLLHVATNRPGTFWITGVWTTGQGLDPTAVKTVSTTLLGTDSSALHTLEEGYIDSRRTGIELAAKAFASQPVRGIGTDRFPAFADARATYGALPTHNTYAQIAAELGAVGLLLFGVGGATLLLAARRSQAATRLRAASVGVVAAGSANLMFINALASPGMLLPLIVAATAIAGWAGPPPAFLQRRRSADAASGEVADAVPARGAGAEAGNAA